MTSPNVPKARLLPVGQIQEVRVNNMALSCCRALAVSTLVHSGEVNRKQYLDNDHQRDCCEESSETHRIRGTLGRQEELWCDDLPDAVGHEEYNARRGFLRESGYITCDETHTHDKCDSVDEENFKRCQRGWSAKWSGK